MTMYSDKRLHRGDFVTVKGRLHIVVKVHMKTGKLVIRPATRWANFKFQVKRKFGRWKSEAQSKFYELKWRLGL